MGVKRTEAMLNRIVARRTGVSVERVIRAATKERPHITFTVMADTMP
jgi:hypothetical protein